MGERAIENRVKKLKAIEAQQKALEQEADKLKEEIKKKMEARGAEELKAGSFLVRWKSVIGSRFDSKAFQKEHKALYSQYLKQTEGKRFTVA
ncbi:hypothetical protein [Clostridium sp. Marseille-P2415]|uniref:hypothetical protein n=1 Tax=Clostridium sp. Marseille-P2415 TaxID=1805471 RepID=UPI00098848C0|nr:hypothetical protein [Clostridium sp. Marseille-P2415]